MPAARRYAVLLISCLALATRVSAEDGAGQAPPSGQRGAFAGGAFARSFTSPGPFDPEGTAPGRVTLHESMPASSTGVLLTGGVRVHRHWSIGGELLAQASRSAVLTEDTIGITDRRTLVSRHASRDTLFAALARWPAGGGQVRVEPLAGIAMSHVTSGLTQRRGTYFFGETLPVTAPDIARSTNDWGIVAGADVLFRIHDAPLSVVAGFRFFALDRAAPASVGSSDVVPSPGGRVTLLAGGLRWR